MSRTMLRERTALGDLIYNHRLHRGWSREDLARRVQLLASTRGYVLERGERVNMHPNTIANWEKRLGPGERIHLPQRNTLHRVAEALSLADGSSEHIALFDAWRDTWVLRQDRRSPGTKARSTTMHEPEGTAITARSIEDALQSVGLHPIVVTLQPSRDDGLDAVANALVQRFPNPARVLVVLVQP